MTDSVWNDLVGGAKSEAESFENRSNKSDKEFTPMVFLREGSHKLRFYPDKRNTSRIRLIRRVAFHKATVKTKGKDDKPYDKSYRVRCEGESHCKVCDVMQEANKQGYAKSWTHWNTTGLAYAVIFQSTDTSKFILLNQPVVVALEGKMIYAINKLIAGHTGAEIQTTIDTLEPSMVIEIDHKGGAGGNSMARFDPFRKEPLPPLPDHFDNLDDMFVLDKPGSDEDVKIICQAIMANVGAGPDIVQPDGTEANKPKESVNVTSQSMNIPGQPTSPVFPGIPGLVVNLVTGAKVPDKAPTCYGGRPASAPAICTACSFEPMCAKLTIEESLAVKK